MSYVKIEHVGRFNRDHRITLSEWSSGLWSFSLDQRIAAGQNAFQTLASEKYLASREAAQTAAMNAIQKLPEDKRKGFNGHTSWRVYKGTKEPAVQAQPAWIRRASNLTTILGVAVAIATALSSFFFSFPSPTTGKHELELINEQKAQIATINATAKDLEQNIRLLTEKLTKSGTQTQLAAALKATQADVTEIKKRLASFETFIGDDPGKRVATLVLRKDLDSLVDRQKTDVATLQTQITQAIDLMKFFIGMLGTAIVASFVNTWLNRPKPAAEK